MTSHYRHTTPYYDLVVLESPARIESLAIDPSGSGRHLGVINNFGRVGTTVFASFGSFSDVESNAVVGGRPGNVTKTADELRLVDIPVGGRGLYTTWSFVFDERTFDMTFDWALERPLADVWELGWKLDAVARNIGSLNEARLVNAELGPYGGDHPACLTWWEDDPRYAHTLVAAYVPDSGDRGDLVRAETPDDRPTTSGMWCTIAIEGGTELSSRRLRGGRWRVGASDHAPDMAYAAALTGELVGGPAALPAPRSNASVAGPRGEARDFGNLIRAPRHVDSTVVRGPEGSWLLADDQVAVAFVPAEDRWECALFAWCGRSWRLAGVAAPHMCFTTVRPEGEGLSVQAEMRGLDDRVETTSDQAWTLSRDTGIVDDADASGVVHVVATDHPIDGHRSHPLHAFIAYPGGLTKNDVDRYDVVSSPVLRPRADLIVGQRALWSPSVHVQHGPDSIALVPDLRVHGEPDGHAAMPREGYFGLALDLDIADRRADGPVLGFGWRSVEGAHAYYFQDRPGTPSESRVLVYDLVVRSGAPPYSVTSDVQRRLWARVGRHHFASSLAPQTQPADAAFDEAWSYWRDFYDSCEVDGKPLGAVRVDRALEPGVNFMSWFNALRTSYGLYTYGRDRADADLLAKARSTRDLLLAAPQEAGAFPTIADLRDDRIEWQAGHRNFLDQMPWGPVSYNTFDMGWAAYWLLRWHQDLEPDSRIVDFVSAYGDFLSHRLLPSGAVPSWFRTGTLDPDPHLFESAHTASSVMLLAELALVTERDEFLSASARAGEYVARHHLLLDRWDDFEPYYSNTLKAEGAADPFSGQHTQNTLSMHFAAVGFLTLHKLTGDTSWLGYGIRAVDSFLRYQYITPGLGLSMNCFGGFAVQNTDNEALDARQSQFGVTLLDYAQATGRADYAERGVAALRAGYATMASPSAEKINPLYFDAQPVGRGPENYAHATFDAPAEYTMFDWGQGSAAAGFAEARNRFGDIWVDAAAGHGYGIDYVRVDHCHIDETDLDLGIWSPTAREAVLLKVSGLNRRKLSVRVNGHRIGTFASAELAAGVPISVRDTR